ncbi:MAG: type 4b pilus protein PilO2 [Alphaproteobacteria bacterium]|nr:type 4b pilus protein PilO2 [Alphaproteobacteria bacterium]
MSTQVININRKKYAVGLFWQPVAVGFAPRNYARNLSRNVDKKLNLYTEYRSMVGLGARRFGQRSGMFSAAAEVMESFSEYTSFLAVFQVASSYYLVAARNGIILADKVFESEDVARREYVALSEIPDWGAFFAPGAWGMPRAAERNLADLLTGHSHAQMHLISRASAGLLSVALIAVFVLLLGFVFRDSVVQVFAPRPVVQELNPELVAEYKRQIEEKNKELDAQFEIEKTLPPEPIVMPYELLPDVAARAQQCYQAIAFLMQPIPGWAQTNVTCGETHAIADLSRSFGTLGDFYTVATELMPGVFVQQIDENTLRVQAALPELEVYSSQDERDADTIVRDVTTAFQGIDTPVDTAVVVDTLTNGVDVASVNVVEVGAQSKLTPMQFMQIFNEFSGVYMIQCAWNAKTRTWNYEVIIYAK